MGIFKWKKIDKNKVDKEEQAQSASAPVEPAGKKVEDKSAMKDLYREGQAGKKPSVSGKTAESRAPSGFYGHVLFKPLVTEKATNLGALNKYAFAVSERANKIEIAKAVRSVYGIKPVSVRLVSMKGKKVRHGRIIGRRKNWKKAIITLPAGQSINIYEGV